MQIQAGLHSIGRLPALRGRRVTSPRVDLQSYRSRRDRISASASATEPEPVESTDSPQAVSSPPADQPAAAVDDRKALVEELLDTTSFGSRGEGWVAAQVAAFAILAVPPPPLTRAFVDSMATLGMLGGAGLVVYSCLNLGTNLTPLPQPRKNHELVVSGLYKYARHPMYGGVLLFALGLALLTHNETRLAAVGLLWWVLENKVTLEERALSERYPEYADYSAKVKKFFPYVY